MKHLAKKDWILLLVATFYLLWPADIIPEIFLGPLGLVDDTAAVAIISALLIKASKNKQTVKAQSFKTNQ